MYRLNLVLAILGLQLMSSFARAANADLSEDELLRICNSEDEKVRFAGKLFVMGVLEVAKSDVVPPKMRICPKGNKTSSQYLSEACDWIAADRTHRTDSAMLAVIASASSEACPSAAVPPPE